MILIDRPMPDSCDKCPCNNDDYDCNLTRMQFDYDIFHFSRMPDCPLIDAGDATSKLEELDALRRVIQVEYDRRQKE